MGHDLSSTVETQVLCVPWGRPQIEISHSTFLLALALMNCMGELHGHSYLVQHLKDWNLLFSCIPEFVAKTQNSSFPDERYESFSVSSLWTLLGVIALCPVWAMRSYLRRTWPLRPVLVHFVSTSKQFVQEHFFFLTSCCSWLADAHKVGKS